MLNLWMCSYPELCQFFLDPFVLSGQKRFERSSLMSIGLFGVRVGQLEARLVIRYFLAILIVFFKSCKFDILIRRQVEQQQKVFTHFHNLKLTLNLIVVLILL